jgi:methylated-DNA-[protein]-cysteine S-methyltransferase
MKLQTVNIESPIGEIVVAVKGDALCGLVFADHWPSLRAWLERRFGALELVAARDPAGAAGRLRAYLDGDLAALDELPVDTGGTEFQRRVWRALREVPAGATASYGDLAARIGQARAVRAVGMANARNPVSLVLPCHRIIGSDGGLHGYGGGLRRKRWLLAHEGVHIERD